MGGWRDEDGRTAADRKKLRGAQNVAEFAANVRHRPMSVLKSALGVAFVLLLIVALLLMLR